MSPPRPLPAEAVRGLKNSELVRGVAATLSAVPLTYSLRRGDANYVVMFCFAKPKERTRSVSASVGSVCQSQIGEGAPMPEFLHDRPLSPEELEMLRQQIEEGYDNIAEVDNEIRGIVARNWPHLVSN